MALIYQSASILRTLSLGIITIFGFVALFFVSAPKLWTGSGLLWINIASADTPHNCDTSGGCAACQCTCSGACACDCSGCSCNCAE